MSSQLSSLTRQAGQSQGFSGTHHIEYVVRLIGGQGHSELCADEGPGGGTGGTPRIARFYLIRRGRAGGEEDQPLWHKDLGSPGDGFDGSSLGGSGASKTYRFFESPQK